MGQKVHPGGLRVGVRHGGARPVAGEWKSHWYTSTKEFAAFLIEDVKIRAHINGKLCHAGLSDILIQKDKQRVTIDIYTARPGIVIGKSGSEVDALRKEIHGSPRRASTSTSTRSSARSWTRSSSHSRWPSSSRTVSASVGAMKRSLASAIRSGAQGVKISCGGPARRRRDVAPGDVLRRARAASHAAGRHRLRLRRGEDDLRPHRGQGLDQQGRGHARRVRRRRRSFARPGAVGSSRASALARGRPPSGPDREGLGPVRKRRGGGGGGGGGGGRRGGAGGGRRPRGQGHDAQSPDAILGPGDPGSRAGCSGDCRRADTAADERQLQGSDES